MSELKPCPFCGGEVSMTYCGADNTYNVYHKGEPNTKRRKFRYHS